MILLNIHSYLAQYNYNSISFFNSLIQYDFFWVTQEYCLLSFCKEWFIIKFILLILQINDYDLSLETGATVRNRPIMSAVLVKSIAYPPYSQRFLLRTLFFFINPLKQFRVEFGNFLKKNFSIHHLESTLLRTKRKWTQISYGPVFKIFIIYNQVYY